MTSPTTTTQSAWLDDLRKDLPCHISVQVFEQPLESEPSARISVSTWQCDKYRPHFGLRLDVSDTFSEAGDKRDDLVSCAKSFSEQFKSSTFDLEPHMRILGGEVVTEFLKQVREGTMTSEEVMLRIRKLPDCEAWVNSTVDKSKKRATVVYNVIKAQHPEWTFLSEPSDQYATVSTPDSADGLKACTFRFP
ncbi:hypothetical protein JCM24511_01321 [Saitozyma sp. JCM 24511]|nr:hypothetical protein JCM24511_01321 [Saitozyma sp. JCM 24511]